MNSFPTYCLHGDSSVPEVVKQQAAPYPHQVGGRTTPRLSVCVDAAFWFVDWVAGKDNVFMNIYKNTLDNILNYLLVVRNHYIYCTILR